MTFWTALSVGNRWSPVILAMHVHDKRGLSIPKNVSAIGPEAVLRGRVGNQPFAPDGKLTIKVARRSFYKRLYIDSPATQERVGHQQQRSDVHIDSP